MALFCTRNAADTWSVAFNFGRIGYPRAWAHKVEGVSFAKARRAFDALLAEAEKDPKRARQGA